MLQPPDFYLHDVEHAAFDGRFACEVIREVTCGKRTLTLVRLDRSPRSGSALVLLTERESDEPVALPIADPHDVHLFRMAPSAESKESLEESDLHYVGHAVISPT